MAFFGLFGNYDKPGPGVSKDEPPKAAPIRFFEIFGRKFSKLVQANLIFLLPTLGAIVFMVLIYLFPTHFVLQLPTSTGTLQLDLWAMYAVPLPLVLLAPFGAGLTYITRNFAREEHAFVWSDFWDAVKGNWKYFLLNGVIVYAAYVVLSFSLLYYSNQISQDWLFYIPFWVCILLAVVFLWAQFYLPVMFVTFDLTFRQAYKNAFIFSIAGFLRNLLLTVIIGGLGYLVLAVIPVAAITVFVYLLLLVFLIFSFFSFLVNFTVYPLIDQYLIKPYQERLDREKYGAADPQPEKAAPNEPERFPGLFTQEDEEDEEEDSGDKYVYVNGRLIKKSELKGREGQDGPDQ